MTWAKTLAVVAALVCVASVQSQCPSGWEDLADSGEASVCFYFMDVKGTWYDLRGMCQMIGGDLAWLDGDYHQKVVEYINDNTATGLDLNAYWIGGTDEGTEGSWRWVVDGSAIPLGTPHWYPCNGQPNGGTTQNHLSLYTPDFYFHSLESTRVINGICRLLPV